MPAVGRTTRRTAQANSQAPSATDTSETSQAALDAGVVDPQKRRGRGAGCKVSGSSQPAEASATGRSSKATKVTTPANKRHPDKPAANDAAEKSAAGASSARPQRGRPAKVQQQQQQLQPVQNASGKAQRPKGEAGTKLSPSKRKHPSSAVAGSAPRTTASPSNFEYPNSDGDDDDDDSGDFELLDVTQEDDAVQKAAEARAAKRLKSPPHKNKVNAAGSTAAGPARQSAGAKRAQQAPESAQPSRPPAARRLLDKKQNAAPSPGTGPAPGPAQAAGSAQAAPPDQRQSSRAQAAGLPIAAPVNQRQRSRAGKAASTAARKADAACKTPKASKQPSSRRDAELGSSASPTDRVTTPDAAAKTGSPGCSDTPFDDLENQSPRNSPPKAAMEADASPMAASARRAAAVPVPATVHPIPERTNDELIEVWTEAFRYLKIRLLDIRSEACASIEMRPLLRAVHGKLLSLLTDTVQTAGANNSFLLIGPRGTGKTLVIQRALSDLHKRFNTDPASPQVGFVRLTGLAHTEDRSAFREIARQLCETFGMPFVKGASLEENLAFLRDMLKELARAHKVVVFVLDEFDMFTKRAKQTLLYNLLDAMQQADMQAAVVGVSCRGDVMELLEKRVRSRFSYRKELVLAESCLGLGLRPTAAATAGRASATAGMGPAPATSAATAAAATAATAASGSGTGADAPDPGNCPPAILRAMLSLPAGFAHPDVAASHNAAVARVLQDNTFLDALEVICKKGFSTPRDLVDVCVIALCGVWEPEKEGLSVHSMLAAVQEVCSIQDSQSMMVGSLSVLELYMLVAIQRIRRRGPQACNFEQVFDEYRRSLQLEDHPDKFSRAQAFRAFERLLSMALTFYVDPKAEQKGGLREFHAVAINVSHEEIEAGMKTVENCPSRLLTWLNREAVQASYAAD